MIRLLLARSVDRDAIDQAASARGWPLLNLYRRTDARPRQVVFGTTEWLLTFIDDHRIDARYVVIEGHDEDGLAETVRDALPTLELDDVLAMLETERLRALCWLSVVGPTVPTEPVTAILAEAAASLEPKEREAAAFAYEALGWVP